MKTNDKAASDSGVVWAGRWRKQQMGQIRPSAAVSKSSETKAAGTVVQRQRLVQEGKGKKEAMGNRLCEEKVVHGMKGNA